MAFEEKRSAAFFRYYRIILLSMAFGIMIAGVGFYWELSYRKAFDLFVLFREDREIISEYWVETLETFFYEVPRKYLVFIGFGLSMIGAYVFFAKPIREKLKRITDSIAKWKRNGS